MGRATAEVEDGKGAVMTWQDKKIDSRDLNLVIAAAASMVGGRSVCIDGDRGLTPAKNIWEQTFIAVEVN
jgi:hypothetical protein